MWRSRSGRGRVPNKCSHCGLPTKKHDGPYGPRCLNLVQTSSAAALQYELYMDNNEKELQRQTEKSEGAGQNGQNKGENSNPNQEVQQEQEEEPVKEEVEPENAEGDKVEVKEQLKDILKA